MTLVYAVENLKADIKLQSKSIAGFYMMATLKFNKLIAIFTFTEFIEVN